MIAGLVVAGFGGASIYTAPLTNYLLKAYGVQGTFYILGALFFVVMIVLAQYLSLPSAGYVPKSYQGGYTVSGILMVVAAVLALLTKAPKTALASDSKANTFYIRKPFLDKTIGKESGVCLVNYFVSYG